MALPTTGLTTNAVASALGEASNDVGTLCKSNKINKWSKWKPIQNNKVTGLTLTDLQNANFGFTIPNADADEGVALAQAWTYNKPTGGAASPYRLGDFRGYEHNSIRPFNLLLPDYVNQNQSGVVAKLILPTITADNVDGSFFFGNMYFGVLIKKGTQVEYKTAATKISAGGTTVDFSESTAIDTTGTFDVYCFYTATAIATMTNTISQILYSLNGDDGVAHKTVTVYVEHAPVYGFGLSGLATADRTALLFLGTPTVGGGVITQSARITRELTREYSLNNIRLRIIRHSDSTEMYNQIHSTDINSSPEALYPDDPVDMILGFSSSIYKDVSTLDTLYFGDYYEIYYTFNYV